MTIDASSGDRKDIVAKACFFVNAACGRRLVNGGSCLGFYLHAEDVQRPAGRYLHSEPMDSPAESPLAAKTILDQPV